MEQKQQNSKESKAGAADTRPGRPDLKDPRLVLSLLEADQVVAAKSQSRFGRRPFSFGVSAALWGLRIYVLFMMVIVLISVIHAVHGAH